MRVLIPFHSGDFRLAVDLLEWCQVLGDPGQRECVLVPDPEVPWYDALELNELAETVFGKSSIICPPETCSGGWPAAPNRMFLFAAEEMAKRPPEPWLWLEPDAIPIQPHWSDLIATAYEKCGKPYMGAVIEGDMHGKGFLYLNGVAVYPHNAVELMGPVIRETKEAFDVACAAILRPLAANTPLIHCHWGRQGVVPIFGRPGAARREHMLTLESLRPGAVLFHRCKDGSLIDLLTEKRNGANGSRLVVVMPFCNKDGPLAEKNVRWMVELGSRFNNKAILCYPRDTLGRYVGNIEVSAKQVFGSVERFVCPGNSSHQWPIGPNIAWQAAARYMQRLNCPWLWLEADASPVVPNWLSRLEREYLFRKKGFFGPIVANRGHMNGVAIYPANTPNRCPLSMAASGQAWDWILGGELGRDVFDAGALIQHCWGIVGGKPHSHDGPAAHFGTKSEVDRWLQPTAVLFHRCKDGSLIDRLRELGKP